MIFGTGTDIVEVKRISQRLENGNGFKNLVFSVEEITYCESKANPSENFAARFAAKEAFLKALGTGMYATFELSKIQIINNSNGSPSIILSEELKELVSVITGTKNFKILTSLSHTSKYATAVVLIEILEK